MKKDGIPKIRLIALLNSSRIEFEETLTASYASGLKTGLPNLIAFIRETEPNIRSSDSEALEVLLLKWKETFLFNSELSPHTTRDYFMVVLKFLKSLIKDGLLPPIRIPTASTARSATPLNKPNVIHENTGQRPKSVAQNTLYEFRCNTGTTGEVSALHNLACLKSLKRGEQLAEALKNFLTGYAGHSQYRRVRVFKLFVEYLVIRDMSDILDGLDAEQYQQSIYEYFYFSIEKNTNSIISFNSDWIAFSSVIIGFKHAGLFPDVDIPQNVKVGSADLLKLKRTSRLLSMSLKGVSRYDVEGRAIENAYTLAPVNNDEFLNALERDERYIFNLIRSAAIREVKMFYKEFKTGQSLINKRNTKEILDTYDQTGEMIDRRFTGNSKSKPLSFFSKAHPEGLSNLLSMIWHTQQGCANRSAFPGAHRIDEYGTDRVRNMLGLNTKNALPFFLVILGETGFNVDSLEKAEIEDKNGKRSILCASVSGDTVRVEVKKPRASRTISKLIQKTDFSSQDECMDDMEINAYSCISMLLEMTKHRRTSGANRYLWINTSNKLEANRISSTAYKTQFSKFLNRHAELKNLNHDYLSRAAIRVSGGVLKWFETGGDMKATAAYLGNSVAVALRSYVPQSIQEILHRREMRRHQTLLILCSTSNSDSLRSSSLPRISKSEISKLLQYYASKGGLNIQELDEKLFGSKTINSKEARNIAEITFVLSPENIAILKLINEAVSEATLARPDTCSITTLIGSRSWNFWQQLWSSVSSQLSRTGDRGHKLIFQQGIEVANSWSANQLKG